MNVNTLPRRRFQRTSAEGGGGGGQGQNGESQNNQQQNNQQQNNQQQQGKPFVPIATQEEFNTRIQERIDRAVAIRDYDKVKAEAEEFSVEKGTWYRSGKGRDQGTRGRERCGPSEDDPADGAPGFSRGSERRAH
jgi:hypothetical protein